jgi:glycosyltransferase involved in cell wall biosynthesis
MRIALFSWEAAYGVAVGGVAVHVSSLAQALAARGHEIHVFTRLGPDQRLYDNVFGVHYHRCPVEKNRNFVDEMAGLGASFAHYARETSAAAGRFDVLHVHDWLPAAAGLRLKAENAGRLAVTFHTTELGRSGAWPDKGESRRISELERDLVREADAVIAVSHEVRRQLDQLYQCPDWKASIVYHGVDLARFDRSPFDAGAVKAAAGIGALAPTVLYVGSLSHRKGPDLLLQAAPLVLASKPDVRFLFVGDGDLRTHLERETDRFKAREAVRFLGGRTGGEIVDLYRACDAVCIPSRADPFGIVALSAWAAGKPLVATRAGSPKEFVLNETNGLLADPEPAAIASALLWMLEDFDRLRWMGRNGRVAAETAFTWDVVAEKTLESYRAFSAGKNAMREGPSQ